MFQGKKFQLKNVLGKSYQQQSAQESLLTQQFNCSPAMTARFTRLSAIWQVGLDIQNHSVRAVAVQRRRCGWQLRQWWQQTSVEPLLRDGRLQSPEILSALLRRWRSNLPRHISVRIGLPAQRVLQQSFPVPDSRLREPERSWYIQANAGKQFPVDSQTLTLDYRADPLDPERLCVTAARQDEINAWLRCLQAADLNPQVIDITPSVLRCMATCAGLSPQYPLLHRLEDEWLAVASLGSGFAFTIIPCVDGGDAITALAALPQHYYSEKTYSSEKTYDSAKKSSVKEDKNPEEGRDHRSSHSVFYYSSVLDEVLPAGAIAWSPFTVFRQLQPPLPFLPSAFVLAAGLALRSGDC